MYCHPTDGIRTDFVNFGDKKTSCLSLNEDQFSSLYFLAAKIDEVVRKFLDATFELGDDVIITHSKFRGSWLVNIRQYYVDDTGDKQPSRWGMVFRHDVWRKFTATKLKLLRK